MSYSQIIKTSEIDNNLVGNPQITYFKSVYRRHTPFYKGVHTYADKTIESGGIQTEDLSHGSYDLITNIFLENKITKTSGTIYANLGNNIVEDIKFKVGQTELCRTYGLYMETRAELDHPYVPSINNSHISPPIMVGSILSKCNTGSQYNVQTMAGGVTGKGGIETTDTFYTYPNFYFCGDYGNAFPICALNNSDVVLEINYRNHDQITLNTISEFKSTVNVEYINLSDDERMRFINNTDMYIYYDIEHLDFSATLNYNNGGKNHPIRQFFFVGDYSGTPASEMVSLSTPTSLAGLSLTDIDFKINSESLYENNDTNISIFTKQNLNRLYPGYGRKLVTTPSVSTGYNDSIGVHSFCLDTTNTPSGHLSANTPFSIEFKGATSNIQTYVEVIKFYRIMGGQLGSQYI